MQGRIIKAISGFYYIEDSEGEIYECKAKGIFRKEKITPLVGDFVEFDLLENHKGNVASIKERKNELIRPPISNIDLAVLVVSVKNPEPSLLFLDKQIVFLENIGIKPIICINKIDIGISKSIKETYEKIGYDVIEISAKSSVGIEELKLKLNNKVSVLVGNSGVGKSSITNKIIGQIIMQEGETSRIEKGKQTTRHVELIKVDKNTYLADSPGFSSFDIDNFDKNKLETLFAEFEQFVNNCRYRGCGHINEEECGIKEAVKQGFISLSRYENYKLIKNGIK